MLRSAATPAKPRFPRKRAEWVAGLRSVLLYKGEVAVNRCSHVWWPHWLLGGIWLVLGGCDALSPSFTSLLDGGTGALTAIDNAPGHVILAFVNRAEVDERLIAYLESAEGGSLVLTNAEKRALTPRVRFRVQVTFSDGEQIIVEFVDGSTALVQPGFGAQSEADLNQNTLNNVVALCDVASVEVLSPIEVFVPVQWRVFTFVEPTQNSPGEFRVTAFQGPEFSNLETDVVDAGLNTLLRRNIGVRDGPAPLANPLCGSVVTIILDGVLSVPFRDDLGGVPGFVLDDLQSAATLGGRYEFRISVQ